MAGYELKEGYYRKSIVSDDELWAAFSCVFSSKSKNTSSYKYGFLKAIIDNLYNVDEDLKLSFDLLFSKFGEIYWNLILKHGLRQTARTNDNRETYLEQILHTAVANYNIDVPIPYEQLTPEMMIKISHQIKVKCKKYVVGALFEDTNRLFYSFSKKEEWIQINPLMYKFICKHKVFIEKVNYYEWAKFLEKTNNDSVASKLLDKIDASAKRNNLSLYRQILFDEFESKYCFYCGKRLRNDSIHVDHFIPWSFIKDDKLWNFVLSCSDCNIKKRDQLTSTYYLDKIIDRNRGIQLYSCDKAIQHLDTRMELCCFEDMQNYHQDRLRNIYTYALQNGFTSIWKPKNIRVI